MRQLRHGVPVAGRARLELALSRAELSDQALINFVALSPYSGPAWTDRYAARPNPHIPAQRRPIGQAERDLEQRLARYRADRAREDRHRARS